jgi:hypothetical protein
MLGFTNVDKVVVVFIAASFVAFTVIFIRVAIMDVQISFSTVEEQLNAIDTSHAVKSCFSENGIIYDDFLEKEKGKKLTELCSLYKDVKVTVRDWETGKTWSFGKMFGDYSHKTYTRIGYRSSGEIHMGEVHVTF